MFKGNNSNTSYRMSVFYGPWTHGQCLHLSFKCVADDGQLLFFGFVCCRLLELFVHQFVRKRKNEKNNNYVSSLPHLPPAMESKKTNKTRKQKQNKKTQFVHQEDVLIS